MELSLGPVRPLSSVLWPPRFSTVKKRTNFRSDFECKFKMNLKCKFKFEFHKVKFSDDVFAFFRCWWWWLPLPPLSVVVTALTFFGGRCWLPLTSLVVVVSSVPGRGGGPLHPSVAVRFLFAPLGEVVMLFVALSGCGGVCP